METVDIIAGETSSCWIDGSGTLQSGALTIDSSLFFNSTATLAGLSFSQGTLTTAFAPTNYQYSFTDQISGSLSFSIVKTAGQNTSYTWNGSPGSWAATSSNAMSSESLAIDPNKSDNLTITVVAPDGSTSSTYTVHVPLNISTSTALATVADDLSGVYTLTSDITTSGTWTPIGTNATPFNGTFDGNGHSVSLNITSGGTNTGLFDTVGSSGTVKNLSLSGTINTTQANGCVGSVAGNNYGTITNCTSSVSVTTTSSNGAGGIVGNNLPTGAVTYCVSTGSVSSLGDGVGGIAGTSSGSLYRCYATGPVHTNDTGVGGLVGINSASGTITECYATGNADAGFYYSGGLAGENGGTISDSYARGDASCGHNYAGGFIGINNGTSTVSHCFATGTYTVGKGDYLVASNVSGTFTACYVANPAGGTYYLSTLSTAVPAAWSGTVWGQSASINNGYPYLLYFGSGTIP